MTYVVIAYLRANLDEVRMSYFSDLGRAFT